MLNADLFYSILKTIQAFSNAQKITKYQLHHLRASYMLVFMAIGMAPGIHAAEIALRMGRPRQTLTRRLNELVKKGAIYKDGNKGLFLTEAGQKVYNDMMREVLKPVEELSMLLKQAQPPFYTPGLTLEKGPRPEEVNEYKRKWDFCQITSLQHNPTYATTSPFRQPSATEGGTLGV